MMECKKALEETGGDFEKAILYLRERGMSRAQKKAGRVTSEGLVEVGINETQNEGVVLEINCETDFVSKNEDFQKFAKEATHLALKNKTNSIEDLAAVKMSSGASVQDTLTSLIAKIGENLQLRRVGYLSAKNGVVACYNHMGGKIGALVALDNIAPNAGDELAKDIAMHVAAASPRYLHEKEVDTTELEQEKILAKKKLLEEGKPENMIEKIMMGQVNKFYKEVCLVEQPFIKDPKLSVKQLVAKAGANVTLSGFKRFQLGEGIEKKSEDFAEEVAKLTN
jgi:elongation factor Ts